MQIYHRPPPDKAGEIGAFPTGPVSLALIGLWQDRDPIIALSFLRLGSLTFLGTEAEMPGWFNM